jgi:penicillin-binding protein 1A
MKDEPFEIEVEEKGEMKLWRPNNADGHFSYQTMPIKRALAKSINSITARLTDEVGADTVMYYAKQMGIESPLRPVASIGLGSFDVSLYEMVGAYSAFVNEGIHAEPLLVSEIQDQNGNVIQHFDAQIKSVLKRNLLNYYSTCYKEPSMKVVLVVVCCGAMVLRYYPKKSLCSSICR